MSIYQFRPLSRLIICLLLFAIGNQPTLTVKAQMLDELTLRVTPSETNVEIGDTLVVEGVILKDGGTSSLGVPQFTLSIETSPGVPQESTRPIFEPAEPAAITPGGSQSRASFMLTAVRAGTVTFSMSVNGETVATDDNGDQFPTFTTVSGRSNVVAVIAGATEPVQVPEPVTITLLTAGLISLTGYAHRKRK